MKQRIFKVLLIVAIIAATVANIKYIIKLGNKPNSEITER